jgi:hypothetical protein
MLTYKNRTQRIIYIVLQKNANVFSQATYNDLLHHTFNISSFQHDVTVSKLINISPAFAEKCKRVFSR